MIHPALDKQIAATNAFAKKDKKLVIAIPQHNYFQLTIDCINTLIYNAIPLNVKIIIVDNNSDDTFDFCQEMEQKNVEVILLQENYRWLNTFNFMCSKLFDTGKADYLLYLNNDTLVSKNFINNFFEAFASSSKLGILTSYYNDTNWHHKLNNRDHKTYTGNFKKLVKKIPYCDGTAFGISRTLYSKIGFFDERFNEVGGWGADYDYCIRTKQAGFDIGVAQNCYIDHLKAQTSSQIEDRGKFMSFFEMLKDKYPNYDQLINQL